MITVAYFLGALVWLWVTITIMEATGNMTNFRKGFIITSGWLLGSFLLFLKCIGVPLP